MKIPEAEHTRMKQTLSAMRNNRLAFWRLWRELADYFLPKRYVWLQTDKEARVRNARNPFILDSTGTAAARVLAAGMMNGITSPGRPWFSLRIPGFDDDGGPITQWCDHVTEVMSLVMSESNFYNTMATVYLDLSVFGSAAALIYEDRETVIRCYNSALGEFYFAQDERLAVGSFAREFKYTVRQCVARFGIDNVSERLRTAFRAGGARHLEEICITHLVEPNEDGLSSVPKSLPYRESYWEDGALLGHVLLQKGFNEVPGIFPRWEVTGNDDYGTSPAMDALGDVIQLQQETKRKAQGLDKMVNPPIVADIQLQHRPTALVPGGITYVAGANSVGAKPLYQVQLPIGEISQDIQLVQIRVRETFHNELFNMISQLETVRSATEIDARREEKLVLLGSVLERFENEALDPAVSRIFSICNRARLFRPPPEGLPADTAIQVQYVSILSTAQRAVAAAPTERWIGLVGNVAAVAPQVLKVVNWNETVRGYGLALGVDAKNMRTMEELAELDAAEQEQIAAQNAMVAGKELVDGAETLSKTDVGGGANALQQLFAQ